MSEDLLRQIQLALLFDFEPVCNRVIRIANIDLADIEAEYEGFHLIPSGTPERYQKAYRWGMSTIAIALRSMATRRTARRWSRR